MKDLIILGWICSCCVTTFNKVSHAVYSDMNNNETSYLFASFVAISTAFLFNYIANKYLNRINTYVQNNPLKIIVFIITTLCTPMIVYKTCNYYNLNMENLFIAGLSAISAAIFFNYCASSLLPKKKKETSKKQISEKEKISSLA